MDTSILEDLGLTNAEIKVYIALLELGSSSAGPILEKAELHNSVVHRSLHMLIEKGLISYIMDGKKKLYQATNPEQLLDYVENKKSKLKELLPELLEKQSQASSKQSATIYKGVRGLTEVYTLLVNQKGEYNTFGGGTQCAERMGMSWWLNIHAKREANRLSARQVFDESVKDQAGPIESKKLLRAKYLDADFSQSQETVIVGDFVAIAVFSKDPYAFLIEDKEIANGYRKYFELLWKSAK